MSERRRQQGAEEPTQLRLLPGEGRRDWRLDERTRKVGRRGVAEAREILRHANPPVPGGRRKAS